MSGMKKLFTCIRQGKLDEVAQILDKKPELIACLAKAPPKKDDGQSPLMVAIKSDNPEVAHLLLDRGADVNFRDAPTQPYNESAPIWYNAVGQCFLRARHTVGPGVEQTKKFFELLCRLLDMGMDPNQKFTNDRMSLGAWQYALNEYDYFVSNTLDDPVKFPLTYQRKLQENHQLQEMLKAVLDQLLAHGADIHDFEPPGENGLPVVSVILRNVEEGRELFDGLYGLDPEKLKPFTSTYRGKEYTVQPMSVEERLQQYEVKWRELEPVLRAYYA